jgi:hypothetical protein
MKVPIMNGKKPNSPLVGFQTDVVSNPISDRLERMGTDL